MQPPAPVEALTAAARARQLRIDRSGMSSDGLHETSRDASACADDARRAWVALEPDAAAAVAAGQPLAQVLARIGPQAAEPLYLEAACSAAWARAQGFTPLIERRGELKQVLTRVAQLAPDLDEAGAERELGKLYAALPAYAGGDLREARAHFEAALLARRRSHPRRGSCWRGRTSCSARRKPRSRSPAGRRAEGRAWTSPHLGPQERAGPCPALA